ncbi:MAG TPA: hypothetical protein QF753_06265 [Victivallales bacterium]|nr:hypothetical protein [Victivallales bacterium]
MIQKKSCFKCKYGIRVDHAICKINDKVTLCIADNDIVTSDTADCCRQFCRGRCVK